MKQAWAIRLIWLRNDWKSIVFWALMPIIGTLLFMSMMKAVVPEVKVPVGVVVEDDSALARELVEKLQQTDYLAIRLLRETQALSLLEQHELDSVFVIRRDYEEHIYEGKKRVIEGYASNRSYAYFAAEELVTSHAQEQATRAKLLLEVEKLLEQHERMDLWNKEDILAQSKERQYDKDLVKMEFTLYETGVPKKQEASFITVWSIWSVLALLATLFLFDWVVKERKETVRIRWHYANQRFTVYALWQLLFYTAALFLLDVLFVFAMQHFSWHVVVSLLAYRCTINVLAFATALCIRNSYFYYVVGLFITIVSAVIGGGIIPLDGVMKQASWLLQLNPIYAFLQQQIAFVALGGALLFVIMYYVGGRRDAQS